MKTVKQHEFKEDYVSKGDIILCFLIIILLFLSFD